MRKLVTLIICLSLISGISVINSCKKDKVKGCMDKDSKNYNANAEEDNGSCAYEGSIVFWYNKTTSEFLLSDGAIALTYYVNGSIVGSTDASVYWSGAPDCDQSGSVTIKKDLGSDKTKSFTFSAKDQTGWEYFKGTVDFTANNCTTYQLQ